MVTKMDYTGEIGVILINHSDSPVMIDTGERICQMVITKYEKAILKPVDVLPTTDRGDGGFGHTGIK